MEPYDLLETMADVLERLEISYLVTGSTATIAYGEPRFTNDIDMVVALPEEKVDEFCDCFLPEEYYCSRDAVRQAVAQCSQFNIIHPKSGLKVDVIIPEDSDFNRSRLQRGVRLPSGRNSSAWFASPEDVIIKKLEYYRIGGSDKHLNDIEGVLRIQSERIDRNYIAHWAKLLGLEEQWQAVLDRDI